MHNVRQSGYGTRTLGKRYIYMSAKKFVATCVALLLTVSVGGGTVLGLDLLHGEKIPGLGAAAVVPDVVMSEHASLALFGAGLWLLAANQRRRRRAQE